MFIKQLSKEHGVGGTRQFWWISFLLVAATLAAVGSHSNVLAKDSDGDIYYPDLDEAIEAAAEWLVETHQNSDGGFSSFSAGADMAPSDVSGTADALIALAAAGHSISKPLDYFRENSKSLYEFASLDGSTAAKIVVALSAAGKDPRDFRNHNFVTDISSHLSPDGHYGVESAFNQALVILALAEAGEHVPDAAVRWLIDLQEKDGNLAGSWDDGFGTAGNTDATAMVLLALHKAGHSLEDKSLADAEQFLERTQLSDGSWEYGEGFGGNANSTAIVLRALLDTGYKAREADGQFIKDGITPLTSLMLWQGSSGAFQADFGEGRSDDFFATVQALPALAAAFEADDSVSGAFGGESSLPFWLLGILFIIFVAVLAWYLLARRH